MDGERDIHSVEGGGSEAALVNVPGDEDGALAGGGGGEKDTGAGGVAIAGFEVSAGGGLSRGTAAGEGDGQAAAGGVSLRGLNIGTRV